MTAIIDLIRKAISSLRKWVVSVIRGVMNFLTHIVDWFKNLPLDSKKHTPFIASPELLAQIKNAPIKDCGIFKGVLNEQTNEIEYFDEIKADSLDAQTQSVLGREELVVLS